jgi:hypothetical protein
MRKRPPCDPSFFRLLILVKVRFGGWGRERGEPKVVAERRGDAGSATRRQCPNFGFGVAGGSSAGRV